MEAVAWLQNTEKVFARKRDEPGRIVHGVQIIERMAKHYGEGGNAEKRKPVGQLGT